MPNIVIIEKNGSMKQINIKSFAETDLYKKAGFKTQKFFDCQTIWNVELHKKRYSIHLYAKNQGRAGQENKYEFPPPVDNGLYFGSCVLVFKPSDTPDIQDLTIGEWKNIYQHLYGGFEDLSNPGVTSVEDMKEEIDDLLQEAKLRHLKRTKPHKITKSGYLKDGFVVDDITEKADDDNNEETDDCNDIDDSDLDDTPQNKMIQIVSKSISQKQKELKNTVEPANSFMKEKNGLMKESKPRYKPANKSTNKPANKKAKPVEEIEILNDEMKETNYLDCTHELHYESYNEDV